MCGIFGIYSPNANVHVQELAEKVSRSLSHRGPDDFGWIMQRNNGVNSAKSLVPNMTSHLLMLHYRLSILDLSAQGWQPMRCEEGRYHIIFNGEIYNYRELREELKLLGFTFSSQTDTEVLLKAYVQWGKDCLNRLVGMFAFAIYDSKYSKLFLARDFFGIKPLYFVKDEHNFIFSSEIKAILQMPIKKSINSQRAYYYLRYGLTDFAHETLLSDIQQIPPAHYLEVDLKNFTVATPVRYYSLQSRINTDISYSEAVSQLRTIFLENIELHLRSDVAIGAALSGGIDSSSIVMAVRYLKPDLPLHTFSYIAKDCSYNEEKWIDIVAKYSGIKPHKISFDHEDLIGDLSHLIMVHDEPFGSTSIYAQHRIFKLAKEHGIKVMLDGQGADELLAGYTFYRAARLASLIKQKKFKQALSDSWRQRSYGITQLWLRSMQYLLPTNIQSFLRYLLAKEYVPSWLNKAWFDKNMTSFSPLKIQYSSSVLHDELIHSLDNISLPMLLRYEDRNSMSYSIESRVPFLTTKLANYLFSLPEHFLIAKDGTSKAIFRDAMRGIVPDVILDRRDKIGFATPEHHWLKILSPWVRSILKSEFTRSLPLFNHANLLQEWQAMLTNKSKFDFRFWRWINFIKWSEQNSIEFEN